MRSDMTTDSADDEDPNRLGNASLQAIPAMRSEPAADPLFDEFWAAYPRKAGKQSARRGWRVTRRKGVDPQVVIEAAARFGRECAVRGTDLKYIPHPAAWLNDERYDEPPEDAAAVPPAATGEVRLNEEQLLAFVVRLAANQVQPITAAAEIIRTVRVQGAAERFPVITSARSLELAQMPYPEYLETPEWQQRRRIMLKHAEHRCQVCNQDRQLRVHHRTYERRGNEQPGDLIVLCDECHALYHGKGLLPAESDNA
jgi:hypothetical protein